MFTLFFPCWTLLWIGETVIKIIMLLYGLLMIGIIYLKWTHITMCQTPQVLSFHYMTSTVATLPGWQLNKGGVYWTMEIFCKNKISRHPSQGWSNIPLNLWTFEPLVPHTYAHTYERTYALQCQDNKGFQNSGMKTTKKMKVLTSRKLILMFAKVNLFNCSC